MIPRMEDYMATRQYHAWQCEFIAKLTKSTPVLKCTCIHGLEQQQHSWRVAFDFQLFVYVTATMALGASCLCSWEEYPHWGHCFCKVSQCWTWIVRWPHVIFCDSHVTSCDLFLIVMWPPVIFCDSHVTSFVRIMWPHYHAILSPGNELTRVEGLEGLRDLTELVLDRNKIKVSHPLSTVTNIFHTSIPIPTAIHRVCKKTLCLHCTNWGNSIWRRTGTLLHLFIVGGNNTRAHQPYTNTLQWS